MVPAVGRDRTCRWRSGWAQATPEIYAVRSGALANFPVSSLIADADTSHQRVSNLAAQQRMLKLASTIGRFPTAGKGAVRIR